MTALGGEVIAAAAQAAPVFLDRDAAVEVLVGQIKEAAAQRPRPIVFPEAIIPGYPDWAWRRPAWSGRDWYERLYGQAVDIPRPHHRSARNGERTL